MKCCYYSAYGMSYTLRLFFFCSALLCCQHYLYSQPPNTLKLPKMNIAPGGYDTLGYKLGATLADDASGVVEKVIDPEKYLLGPNDVLTIAIQTAEPLIKDVPVSPDAKVVIPSVGAVDVRDLTLAEAQKRIVQAVMKVYKAASVDVVLKKLKTFKVAVSGAVRMPSMITATSADRVSELISKAGGLLVNASSRKIRVRRSDTLSFSVDLLRFYTFGDDDANPTLHGGDKIFVPFTTETEYIPVQGDVNQPGDYEFVEGDSLLTMIRFAQGLSPISFADSIEISRFEESGLKVQHVFLDVSAFQKNPSNSAITGNIPLRIGDRVYVRKRSDVLFRHEVAISGGVRYPGRYSINKGEDRLRDLINRAGGFTNDAAMEAGVLIRRKDIIWSDREYDRLRKLEPEQMTDREKRYFQTKSSENLGLVSVDFTKIFDNASINNNPLLIDQDSIDIPRAREYVNIIGRVNKPGRIAYSKNMNYLDYITRAGGFGFRADENEVIVQKSTGEQHRAKDFSYRLEPGDNILVPEETDVKFIDVFTKALTITSQVATIVGVILGVVFAAKN